MYHALPPPGAVGAGATATRAGAGVGVGTPTVQRRSWQDDPDADYHVVLQDPEGNEFCVG
jgi:hypothetical protein